MARGVRTLKPLYLRATGAFQDKGEKLVSERARLQAKVREMIERVVCVCSVVTWAPS